MMNGLLGTSASFSSDLSLILTIIFGIAAIGGAVQARRKKFSNHCPVMAVAAMMNWIPVVFVMLPIWIELFNNGQIFAEISSLTPFFHGVLGGTTQILMTYTVARMYWLKQLPPKQPIWLMRSTLILWLLTMVGGSLVYIMKYVL
jgi:putative membrane protein